MSELKPRITENGIDYILVGDSFEYKIEQQIGICRGGVII